MDKVKEILVEELSLDTSALIGCRRRNLWALESDSGDQPWRQLRGNALLAVLGDKRAVQTPAGTVEFFMLNDRWLLQFRGGQWQPYWMEDFVELWSVIYTYADLQNLSPSVVLLTEWHGELTVTNVPMPTNLDHEARVAGMLAELEASPPGRISKNNGRAFHVCAHCPFRTRCNATDKLTGQTQDWSESYRRELG